MKSAAHLIAAEAAADAVRIEARRRDLARHRGVTWSGLGPDPAAPRSPAELRTAAETRLAARRSWAASSDGQLISAIAACQAAAQDVHALGERVRAGVARRETAAWRRRMLREMAQEVHALVQGLTEAQAVTGSQND